MGTFQSFEEIDVWQRARALNRDLSPFFERLEEKKKFELLRQMERSAGSVMDNIAEGFDRDGTKEFVQFLAVAKASVGELRSQLYRAFDRDLLKSSDMRKFQKDCSEIADDLGKFMNYLSHSGMRGKKYVRPNNTTTVSTSNGTNVSVKPENSEGLPNQTDNPIPANEKKVNPANKVSQRNPALPINNKQ
jgi:four helix bundle protein